MAANKIFGTIVGIIVGIAVGLTVMFLTGAPVWLGVVVGTIVGITLSVMFDRRRGGGDGWRGGGR